MARVWQRANYYLYHIKGELQQRNMPMELALLPIVESAYDSFAYSHGRAADLWQIIPGTGKFLGVNEVGCHQQNNPQSVLPQLTPSYASGVFCDLPHVPLVAISSLLTSSLPCSSSTSSNPVPPRRYCSTK